MIEVVLPPQADSDRCSTLELHGRRYAVVCVDGLSPRQQSRPGMARSRHIYHGAELVHFQLGDHRYVLIPDDATMPASTASMKEDSAVNDGTGELRRLLTNRELQIVQLICLGLLTKQVADRLHLSEFTVRSYLKTIYCKLGVRSRGAMVFAYASAFGVAPPAGLVEER